MSSQKWIACREHGGGCGIGVNDLRVSVRQDDSDGQGLHCRGECRGFQGLHVEQIADDHGAADVRREQPQSADLRIVNGAVRLMLAEVALPIIVFSRTRPTPTASNKPLGRAHSR